MLDDSDQPDNGGKVAEKPESDSDLRDKLAKHLDDTSQLHNIMGYSVSRAFKAGWDAARAHQEEQRVSAMTIELHRIMKERDSLKDQLQWSLKNEEQYKQAFAEQCERANQLHAEVGRLKEELVAYQIGSSIEAKAGDEARAERDELRAEVERLKNFLAVAHRQIDEMLSNSFLEESQAQIYTFDVHLTDQVGPLVHLQLDFRSDQGSVVLIESRQISNEKVNFSADKAEVRLEPLSVDYSKYEAIKRRRSENNRLKRQVEVMREALLWMDDAVAAHAMRSKANEALAEVEKIERGES